MSRGLAIQYNKLKKENKLLQEKIEYYESLLYSNNICRICEHNDAVLEVE